MLFLFFSLYISDCLGHDKEEARDGECEGYAFASGWSTTGWVSSGSVCSSDLQHGSERYGYFPGLLLGGCTKSVKETKYAGK